MAPRKKAVLAAALITLLTGGACRLNFGSGAPPEFVPYLLPPWLSEFQLLVYGSPDTDYMRTLGATATTWGIFFTGVNDPDRAYLDMLRREGFRVFSNFSTMQGYEILDPEVGIEERSACLTLSGEKARFYWSAEQPQPWIPCNNNPEWKNLLSRRMKDAVRAGVHGVHIDEVEGIAGFLFVAGFCPYCMEGFQEHLRKEFPNAKVRRKKFGIEDIATFDYGAYLRGLHKTLREDPNRDLRREFVLFQLLSRRRHIESLVTLAKEEGGTDIAVSANTTFLGPHKQIFMPALDLAVYENFMAPPPKGRYLTMHAWARGIDPAKRFVTFPVSTDMVGFSADDWPVIAFWMLEALAGGQSFLVPYDAYTGPGPRYTVPAEPLAPVGAFLRSYANRFPNPQPIADVGVLYDLATGLDQYIENGFTLPIAQLGMDQSLLGIGSGLEEAHIPYEVVYAGDGRFIRKVPSLDELKRYVAIVLPNAPRLDDVVRQRLDMYRRAGGSVGTSISALPKSPVTTNAGPEVAIVPWQAGQSLLIHVLNYNYDDGTHSFSPVNNAVIWVRLPQGYDPSGRSLTLESPWDQRTSVPFEIADGGLSFTITSLSSFALAVFE